MRKPIARVVRQLPLLSPAQALFRLTRERTRLTTLFIAAGGERKATPFSVTMRRASLSAALPPRASFQHAQGHHKGLGCGECKGVTLSPFNDASLVKFRGTQVMAHKRRAPKRGRYSN
jgi:hypothetical protein